MRENSARGSRGSNSCLSCVLVPLFALGLCLPWKNNSNSANPVPDTNGQTRPLGAVPSGATADSGLPAGDADSMISPSEIGAATDLRLKEQQHSAASSELGKGPASAGTPAGFYAISAASDVSNLSSDIPPMRSLRPEVQAATHTRERELSLASIQERGEKIPIGYQESSYGYGAPAQAGGQGDISQRSGTEHKKAFGVGPGGPTGGPFFTGGPLGPVGADNVHLLRG
jgi:hypothetical protein